jgi:hypothetical protein
VKGIVFNLLEELVCREHGEEAWDELLDAAAVDGAYSSLGNYPDDDMMRLVGATAARLALPPEAVLRWFGRHSMPLLAQRYPDFFVRHRDARSFALTLNTIIHPEVRKVYPGATPPEFDFDTSSPDELLIGYQSPRRLCALAQGFIEGAADHYGQDVAYEHLQCMHHGAHKCLSRVRFSSSGAR